MKTIPMWLYFLVTVVFNGWLSTEVSAQWGQPVDHEDEATTPSQPEHIWPEFGFLEPRGENGSEGLDPGSWDTDEGMWGNPGIPGGTGGEGTGISEGGWGTTGPRMMQSDECQTGWRDCGVCRCCYETLKTTVLCFGRNITDIPQNLPSNATHLTFRETGIVSLTGDVVQGNQTSHFLSKLRGYEDLVHLSFNHNELLEVVDVGAFEFPPGKGSLQHLSIILSPNLKEFKQAALGRFRRLRTLKVASSGLMLVPDWVFFHAGENVILEELDLSDNKFPVLFSNAFSALKNEVVHLILGDNQIETVESNAFQNATIGQITLRRNRKLTLLEERAFADIKMLKTLDVSSTMISSLPTEGLHSLRRLMVQDVPSLKVFPMVLSLSRDMEVANLTYPYHCCAFTHVEKQNAELYERFQLQGSFSLKVSQECSTPIQNFLTTPIPTSSVAAFHSGDRQRRDSSIPRWLKRSIELYKENTAQLSGPGGHRQRRDSLQPLWDSGMWGDIGGDNVSKGSSRDAGLDDPSWHMSTLDPTGSYSNLYECGQVVLDRLKNVTCTPQPDAFNPCEDVMGFLWLRIIVWVVVGTALVGNFLVLTITLCSRFKLTVPKFLMCNLAFADLSLGVYLLMLAVIDLHTMGVYFSYAIPWQSDGGCQVAGFLAIFATSLSVFTLTVITLERWYAISHAIHLNKRLHLRQACTIMVCGWLYAAGMASLPLLGISNYGKTSICLPMETSRPLDQAFVLLLLISNAVAFMIILGCYVDMYRQVRGNNTVARRNDANIAKRMSVLVFTDFICLFPIAFFGLTAAAGSPFITVTDSKILLVFFFPFNSCANPFLYAIFTKQFHKDLFCTLDRLGICKKKAAKYRFTYTSNPMSLSHSRNYAHHVVRHSSAGSVLTSYMSDLHRSSKASITINPSPKTTPHHTPTERKKISPKSQSKGSPKLVSISMNGMSSHNSVSSIELPEKKDGRKLSVVREVSQTSDDTSDVGLEESHQGRPRRPVRSVSEYVEDQERRDSDYRNEGRKTSQVTFSSSNTEMTHVDSMTSDSSAMMAQSTIEEEDSDLDTTSEDEDHNCSMATLRGCQEGGSGICRDHKYELKDMSAPKGHSPETLRLLKTPSPCDTHGMPPLEAGAVIENLGVLDSAGHKRGQSPNRSPLMKQKCIDVDNVCQNQSSVSSEERSPDGYVNTSYSSPLNSPESTYKDFR